MLPRLVLVQSALVLIQQELVLEEPQLVLVQQVPVQVLVAEPLEELVLVALELNELATEQTFELKFVIPQ